MLTCNVCNKNEALGVASSALGAISFAYCRTCLDHNADPYWIIQSSFKDCRGEVAEWAQAMSIYRNGVYTRIRDLPKDWWDHD